MLRITTKKLVKKVKQINLEKNVVEIISENKI